MPAHAFYIYTSMGVSNVSFSSSRTPKNLLEVTRETKLLSMEITLDKSPNLVFKLYVDPTTINLVLRGWNWSLLRAIFSECRESEDSHEKSIFLLFRQNIPLGELI